MTITETLDIPGPDTRVLLNATLGPLSGSSTTIGPYWVGPDTHVFIDAPIPLGPGRRWIVQFIFYTDSTLSRITDTFNFDGSQRYTIVSGTRLQQYIPVLGPYMRVFFSYTGATPSESFNLLLLGCNRTAQQITDHNRGRLICPTSRIPVGGGLTVDTQLVPTVGGPGMFSWHWSGVAYTVQVFTQDSPGFQNLLMTYNQASAPLHHQLPVVWPGGNMFLRVISGDGAAQTLFPALTLAG